MRRLLATRARWLDLAWTAVAVLCLGGLAASFLQASVKITTDATDSDAVFRDARTTIDMITRFSWGSRVVPEAAGFVTSDHCLVLRHSDGRVIAFYLKPYAASPALSPLYMTTDKATVVMTKGVESLQFSFLPAEGEPRLVNFDLVLKEGAARGRFSGSAAVRKWVYR